MRQIKATYVPPCREPSAFGSSVVRSYVLTGASGVIDPVTRVRAGVKATLDGELDEFMRARLACQN